MKDGLEKVRNAARVVPTTAERIEIGQANLLVGYWHDPKPRLRWDIRNQRVRDVERAIMVRHNGPCDTDDGEVYFIFAANILAPKVLGSNVARSDPLAFVNARLRKWAAEWTPCIPEKTVDRITTGALADPRRWRADSAAKLLRLTMAERTAARITTIGAIDLDKAGRQRLRKERKREAQRSRDTAERRARGAKTRQQYEAESFAQLCRQLGISRSTGYRWRRAGKDLAALAHDRLSVQQEVMDKSLVGQTTCVTSTPTKDTTVIEAHGMHASSPVGEVCPHSPPIMNRYGTTRRGGRSCPVRIQSRYSHDVDGGKILPGRIDLTADVVA